MTERIQPLVAADVDLKDFAFTPIYRAQLFGSSFHAKANDAEWRAGVTLWLKSWDQVPAGTLPEDDTELARLAEFGRDVKAWLKVKTMALHNWAHATDGRLHHVTVADGINAAWSRKQAQRDRTQKARDERQRQRLSQSQSQSLSQTPKPSVTENATETVTASKGQGQGQGQGEKKGSDPDGSDAATASADVLEFDPRAAVFRQGLDFLAKNTGKSAVSLRPLLGRWVRDHGDDAVILAFNAASRDRPIDPVAWIEARLRANGRASNGFVPMHPGAGG